MFFHKPVIKLSAREEMNSRSLQKAYRWTAFALLKRAGQEIEAALEKVLSISPYSSYGPGVTGEEADEEEKKEI